MTIVGHRVGVRLRLLRFARNDTGATASRVVKSGFWFGEEEEVGDLEKMMSAEMMTLLGTAVTLGFFHTLMGPDHYLPFVMMGMARKWSLTKTSVITALCGLGHVLSSVALGFLGVALGLAVQKLEAFEGMRGEWAAWLLIGFGLAYFVWGMRRAWKNKPHTHRHFHTEGGEHVHEHKHAEEHSHVHASEKANITPWVLFVIFVLGPCEPLIPLLMYPAMKGGMADVALVAGVFSAVTIGTMLTVVIMSLKGIHLLPMKKVERYTHALAGAAICLCGCAIQFLGL